MSRRDFLGAVPAALAAQSAAPAGISRREVVSRHNPTLRGIDPRSPLSVWQRRVRLHRRPHGLQTFPQPYEAQMPLCTQAQWDAHRANPTGKAPADLDHEFDTFGRKWATPRERRAEAALRLAPRESARLHCAASASPSTRLKTSASFSRRSTCGAARCTARSNGAARRSRWRRAAIPRKT